MTTTTETLLNTAAILAGVSPDRANGRTTDGRLDRAGSCTATWRTKARRDETVRGGVSELRASVAAAPSQDARTLPELPRPKAGEGVTPRRLFDQDEEGA